MSYDVLVEGSYYGNRNYTYNVAPMLYEDGFWWRDYHRERVPIIKQRLDILIDHMQKDPERFQRHNPKNGWGDYHGCLNWLEGIRSDCVEAIQCSDDPWRLRVLVS